MRFIFYLRTRRLDLDLEPPLALRLVGFCSAESVERFTPRARGSGSGATDAADAFVLRVTDADADGATDAATADVDGAADAADALLCAVACLAREFLSSRLASAACCFAAAAAAAAAAASCFAAAALIAPDISSSNANLAAGSTDANLTLGHLKLSFSSLACLNGQNGFGHFGSWFIGVQPQTLNIGLGPMGSFVNSANTVCLIAGECIAATDACVLDSIILAMAAGVNDNLGCSSN